MSQIGQAHPRLRPFEWAARPVVGYAHDYPSGWRTALHAHPKAQLLHATLGVMRVRTPRASYVVPPGTGLFVPADALHAVQMDGKVAMRALFLQPDAAPPPLRAVAAIAVSPLLRELILAACAEPVEWSWEGRGKHLAALAADEIGRALQLPLSLPVPHDPRLLRVAEVLLAHPGHDAPLEGFAAMAGASVRTLARLFQRETGMGFQQWRRQLRLVEALAVLSAGGTLAQAAETAGYTSGPAFGAAFRGAFGTTPGAARANRTGSFGVGHRNKEEAGMAQEPTTPEVTGTTGAPNPKTGSADAARGLGGHSKDADHSAGEPAGFVEKGEPKTP